METCSFRFCKISSQRFFSIIYFLYICYIIKTKILKMEANIVKLLVEANIEKALVNVVSKAPMYVIELDGKQLTSTSHRRVYKSIGAAKSGLNTMLIDVLRSITRLNQVKPTTTSRFDISRLHDVIYTALDNPDSNEMLNWIFKNEKTLSKQLSTALIKANRVKIVEA